MAVDKNKITAEATKYVQKGQYDKAIRAYDKVLAEDPKDVRVLLKVGELHQKKGDNLAAAEAFNRVAEAYGDQGFFLKAVAVYKQVLKLTPDDPNLNERMAALYQQLGLLSDAMAQLQIVAANHEKAGDAARLTEVLRRMVELDPDNLASSIKLGELYAKSGKGPEALQLFQRAAADLKANHRTDDYVKVAERIALLSPDDVALARELAQAYLAKGDTKRALVKLQQCFKADRKDVETLTMLAQAFTDLGQTSKTISVFKELARVHDEQGRRVEARGTWTRILDLSPDDPDAAEALGAGPPPPTPAPHAAPPAAAPRPPPTRTVIAPAPPQKPLGPDAIPRLLTETDVYVKYGLHPKALDHLGKVFAIDPENPAALEKARDVQEAAGNRPGAAESALRAVRACLARGLAERVGPALARLRELAPGHPELEALARQAGAPAAEAVLAEDLVADDLALAAVSEGEDELVAEEARAGHRPAPPAAPPPAVQAAPPAPPAAPPPAPQQAPAAPLVAAPPAAQPAPPALPDLSEEIGEADFYAQQGLVEEARDQLRELLARHPGHPAVAARLRELEAKAPPEHEVAVEEVEAEEVVEAPPVAAPPPAAPAPAPRAALELQAASHPPAEAPPAPSIADESFDIARELAEELGSAAETAAGGPDDFQYSVEDVFNQFKKGVEKTVRPEDSETHYDLGIAYKEMGLLDDALHEFEVALAGKSRKKEVDCLTMVGLCRTMKGQHREAVEAYRRALRSDFITADGAKAIHYELGLCHEALQEPEVALWYLQKIAKVDARYRDVAAAVERLGGGPGRPPDGPGGEPPGGPPRGGEREPAVAEPGDPAARPGAKKNIGYL
jgi:tetratricopeptide (TPR) repeat protein